MNAPAFCIRTTRDFVLRPRLRLFLCPPRSPPPFPPRRLHRSVDDIRGEDIVVAKPDEDEDVNDDETTLLAFSSSARKLRRPPKPPLERPDDTVVKAPLRRARIALPRRAKERLCTCDEISKSFVQFHHNSTRSCSTTKKTDGRKKKRVQLFVPPSLFLVAFDDEFKDGTRVLTRYVRV